MLAFIDKKITSFQDDLKDAQSRQGSMMKFFKYPNLTMLSTTTFVNLIHQLKRSISLLSAKKTLDTLPSQYNFYYILRIV